MSQQSIKTDGQFLILGLDQEISAVPVEVVREILDMREMFRVPDAPGYLAGLIDVRGKSVPIIDLRLKLGLAAAAVNQSTRIIVLELPVSGRQLALGLIADRVYEVAPLDEGRLEPPPDIGARWRSDYIRGIGRRRDNFVLVFDLVRLFASEEVACIGNSESTSSRLSFQEA